jgi:cob(I)alamin adenosyltransferase
MLKKGYIQIYTGDGKGKTTAAIGLSLRAAGAGLKVYFYQFLKGLKCSELNFLSSHPRLISIKRSGSSSFVFHAQHADFKQAQKCFHSVSNIILKGKYDVIILDEIFHALSLNLINSNELITLLKMKPKHVEIVLTGRNAPNKIIKIADLVTEMKEIKHYFKKGVKARKGIEN